MHPSIAIEGLDDEDEMTALSYAQRERYHAIVDLLIDALKRCE